MSAAIDLHPSTLERIRHDLVGLKMPRALEALDHLVRRLEHGEVGALEAIDILLSEELTLRENSRIKTALRMGRLATIKTLSGFDFSFQPSLDRDRIFTLAQLGFIGRSEVVHLVGRLDHNETRSWHDWHRHVSLVMIAFAMMAVIRHRANATTPPKTMPRVPVARRHR